MLDATDFEHWEDDYDDTYKFKGANRDRRRDSKDRMIENGRGLKTVILPLLGKKAREAKRVKSRNE